MSTYKELETLVETFQRDVGLARNAESPNPEDDLPVRVAIVGFSYNSPTETWAKGHYDFVRARLDQKDYGEDELSQYGEKGMNVKLFYALGIGYLLGLYNQNRISDLDFEIGEKQLPGITMLHLSKLTRSSIDRS